MIHMMIEQPDHTKRSTMSLACTKGKDDIHYIHAKFEVASGPHAGRKFDQNFTVAGGKTDSQGRSIAASISGQTIRAMWEAHKGIDPSDMSQAAINGRMINDYVDLHDIFFPAVIAIRAGSNGYGPKNEIFKIITPDKEEYARLRNGETLDPLPIGIIGEGKEKPKPASTQPAWAKPGQGAAAAQPEAAAPVQEAIPGVTVPPAVAAPTMSRPAWAK